MMVQGLPQGQTKADLNRNTNTNTKIQPDPIETWSKPRCKRTAITVTQTSTQPQTILLQRMRPKRIPEYVPMITRDSNNDHANLKPISQPDPKLNRNMNHGPKHKQYLREPKLRFCHSLNLLDYADVFIIIWNLFMFCF